eukprot:TRINITY_DN268_c1_g1_i3.p1 TRINITY_DN268_c1_g1~~TRINITY_DN268_c1_g1_i3.p1  ORF type:complete len:276 (+),score=38.93 TRINITY_DN268_c1_g1_i3:344-1171(+)
MPPGRTARRHTTATAMTMTMMVTMMVIKLMSVAKRSPPMFPERSVCEPFPSPSVISPSERYFDGPERCFACGEPGHIAARCTTLHPQQEQQQPPHSTPSTPSTPSTKGALLLHVTMPQRTARHRSHNDNDDDDCYSSTAQHHNNNTAPPPASVVVSSVPVPQDTPHTCYKCGRKGHRGFECSVSLHHPSSSSSSSSAQHQNTRRNSLPQGKHQKLVEYISSEESDYTTSESEKERERGRNRKWRRNNLQPKPNYNQGKQQFSGQNRFKRQRTNLF